VLKVGESSSGGGISVSKKRKDSKSRTSRTKKEAKPVDMGAFITRINRLKPKYMDLGLLVAVVVMALFGLVMVFNASNYNSMIHHGTRFHYLTSQAIGFLLGVILLSATYMIPFQKYRKFYIWIYAIAAVLLVLVFIPGIGQERLGARRWIGIGGFTMQPSEVAKFSFVIFAAAVASGVKNRSGKTPDAIALDNTATPNVLSLKQTLLILGCGLAFCGLILLEPNLSITLVMGMTVFTMLFLCGAKLKHLGIFITPALIALPVMLIAEPYRIRRLLAFIDPWANPKDEGFQLIQSLFSLGNGGLFGVGFGNSTQKHMFLPFSESDFIFSIIGEEFGFIGAMLFMALFAFIIWRIFKVGRECNDYFGKYICFGVATVIFIQSAVNLAVVTGTIPPTGVPLPFISFGGTSLAVCMAAIGIVLNVAKQNTHRLYLEHE